LTSFDQAWKEKKKLWKNGKKEERGREQQKGKEGVEGA